MDVWRTASAWYSNRPERSADHSCASGIEREPTCRAYKLLSAPCDSRPEAGEATFVSHTYSGCSSPTVDGKTMTSRSVPRGSRRASAAPELVLARLGRVVTVATIRSQCGRIVVYGLPLV